MMLTGRFQNALAPQQWQPNVGAYPNAIGGGANRLADVVAPQAPAPMAPVGGAPVYAGSQPAQGFQGDGPDAGGQPAVASPDQTGRGMLGAALTGLGFAASPVGAFAGLLAGMAYDDQTGRQIGSTRGFTDIAMRSVGLPTLGELLGGGQAATFSGDFTTDVPQSLSDALLGAPAMNAGMISGGGGFGGPVGGGAQDFGDTSPNAFGGNSSMSDFGNWGGGSGVSGGVGSGGGENGPGTGGW